MKRPILATLLGLCLVSLAPAAESLETQIKAFQQTVTATLAKATPSTPGERRSESAAYAIAGLSQFSSGNVNSNNQQELDRMVASIVALTPNDPAVTKAAETLLATAKAERQARIDKARSDVDTLLKQAGEACLAAKTPADLDAMLALLAPYGRNSGYDRRVDDQESWQRAANAYRFVTRWQDYLGFLGQGSSNEAASTLRELSNSLDVGIMPRSSILALQSAATNTASSQTGEPANTTDSLAPIVAKLTQAKTLEDFIAVSRSLSSLSPRSGQYQPNSLRQAVANLIEDRQQVLSGNRPPFLLSDAYSYNRLLSTQDSFYNPDVQTALIAFRRETQITGIRLALTGAVPPSGKSDETIEAYLVRIADKFAADNNWMQVRETLELYRTLFTNGGRAPSWLASDIDACAAYLAARNLDLAAQYPSAIASYRRALRNAGRYVPAEAIGARLAELKKTNPEAFADPASSETYTGTPTLYNALQPGTVPQGYIPASIPRPTGELRQTAPTGPITPAATP